MELDGFSNAILALLDGTTEHVLKGKDGINYDDNDKSGLFRVDAQSSLGVLNASISGLAPQTQNIAGSNEIVAVSGQGTGAITLTLGVNDLPTDVEYHMIGATHDNSGAWSLDKDTRSPYAAVELTAQGRDKNAKGNDAAHIALLKGQFFMQPQNLRTNSGTGSINRATDSLQFKAINRHLDDKIVSFGFEKDSTFDLDQFHNDVFPGADFSSLSDGLDADSANAGEANLPSNK